MQQLEPMACHKNVFLIEIELHHFTPPSPLSRQSSLEPFSCLPKLLVYFYYYYCYTCIYVYVHYVYMYVYDLLSSFVFVFVHIYSLQEDDCVGKPIKGFIPGMLIVYFPGTINCLFVFCLMVGCLKIFSFTQ